MNGLTNRLCRFGRIVATGWSFFVFMVWGFCLGGLLYPILRLCSRSARRARERFMVHMVWTWRFFIRMMEYTRAFHRIEVRGLEHFVQNRACLVVANHITLVDIVALGSCIQHFNCVLKTSLWRHPWFGLVVRACGFIPNVGSEDFVDLCRKGFAENRPLIVFPQGSRTPPQHDLVFQRGAAQIAVRTGVPIVPVLLTCEPPTLQKGVPWYRVPERAATLILRFQPPLEIPVDIREEPRTPLRVRALNAFMESYFREALVRLKREESDT